jgi:hypothetical protein
MATIFIFTLFKCLQRQDELNQILGQSLSDADNEAVAREMEALEDEALREEVSSMPNAPALTPAQKLAAEAAQKQAAEVGGRLCSCYIDSS